jgi:mono/diheme cytochrome c family protein
VKPQETEHGYLNIPPDFTWHELRSVQNVEDMYLRLAAGVGGTAMPAWKDTITDQEIWAVSYYVMSLMELKDSPERAKFMQNIKDANK